MKKRFLAALLSLCMTLTLLPTTAFAAVSDSMGNTPEENQAILEQLSALTGDSSDQVLSMLNALGPVSYTHLAEHQPSGKAILEVTFTFFTLGDCCLRPEFLHQLIVLFAEPLGQLLHELFTGYDCLSVFR